MRRLRRLTASTLLVIALGAPASRAADEESSTAIVPVVGNVTGIGGVKWHADVELRNTFGSEMVVAVTIPTVDEGAFLVFTIPGGETIALPDVLREAFGVDGVLAPLVVTTAGRRSVTVTCTIHGVGPKGEVRPQIAPAMYSNYLTPRSIFPSISHDEKFRTNVGLVNLGDSTAKLTLALQRLNGRNLATASVSLPPASLRQVSVASLFPTVTKGSNLVLVVESSSSRAYAYTSVLQNDTHDGVFSGP